MSQVRRRKVLVAAGALPVLAASAPLIAIAQASILKRLGEQGYAAGKISRATRVIE